MNPKTANIKRSALKCMRIFTAAVLLSAAGLQFFFPPQTARADIVAGYTEYYIPGGAEQLLAMLRNNSDNVAQDSMHNVITLPITTPDQTIYYDHWENGYLSGAAGDEVYSGFPVGTILTFESPTIPSNPRVSTDLCTGSTNPSGATTACYDGMDHIFVVGGATSMAQAFWPTSSGTIYAHAWEVYPVKALQASYIMPVGEELYTANPTQYADFDNVYVLVQAVVDGTSVSITNSGAGGNLPATSLNRGQVTQLYHVNTGATITANNPIQVQFIVGRQDAIYDSRAHTLVPSAQWDKQYYSPVSSYNSTTPANVNLYMYNPTGSPLAVTYQDTTSPAGVICTIPATSTLSTSACTGRFVPAGSGVRLSAESNFFAIGEYDSGSNLYNWGFSLIPAKNLSLEYYILWAPGADVTAPNPDPPTANGSVVFVTPTQAGQVFYADYSPTDGTADTTFSLNLLQVGKIIDPDNIHTGMHVWSDYPFAITWGEDVQLADYRNPYIDAGYTILPPNPDWVDIALELNKTANPTAIPNQAGETVEFTLQPRTGDYPLNDIFLTDLLPPYFQYLPGTTTITWPGGSSTADPESTGVPATGQFLRWPAGTGGITNLAPHQSITLKFKAVTVTGFNAAVSINNATATGTWAGKSISASAQATVVAGAPGYIKVIKDSVPDDPQDFEFNLLDLAIPNDPTNFILDDDADPAYLNNAQYGLRPGTYSVSETATTGWELTSVVCTSSLGDSPAPTSIVLTAGETVTCTFTNTQVADFGDLPDGYGTLLASNGPRHSLFPDTSGDGIPDSLSNGPAAIWLGASVSAEVNGQPSVNASLDTFDDGVTLLNSTSWTEGVGGGTLRATLNSSAAGERAGYLAVWFDWNHDGDFSDSGELGISQAVSWTTAAAGTAVDRDIIFDIPDTGSSLSKDLYYRVRLFTAAPAGLATAFSGPAINGEVEDYRAPFETLPVTLTSFKATRKVDTLSFDWSTGTEIGTLGFNLYVEDGNGRQLLNDQLIPSSGVDSHLPQYYHFDASAGLISGQARFYLEEVDMLGRMKLHGPFELIKVNGKRIVPPG
jgi:uncharacterized repeat protein (TIGR01451 family)